MVKFYFGGGGGGKRPPSPPTSTPVTCVGIIVIKIIFILTIYSNMEMESFYSTNLNEYFVKLLVNDEFNPYILQKIVRWDKFNRNARTVFLAC